MKKNLHTPVTQTQTKTLLLHELPMKLLPWFDQNKRDLPWRKNSDPYFIWVSEIMLQQTRVNTAITYFNRFIDAFPTIQSLAACDEEKLLKLWEGLGYYSRAFNMKKTAQIISKNGFFPYTLEDLKKLPGIGPYTAGAIASIAFNYPTPAIDGNVIRVIARYTADERPDTILKKELFKELSPIYPTERCGDFTQSLMELGATICLPHAPKCSICPLSKLCLAPSDLLPVKAKKISKKQEKLTLFVAIYGHKIGLLKRKEGVLKNMWQIMNLHGIQSPQSVIDYFKKDNLQATILLSKNHKHIFTHLEWDMLAYYIKTDKPIPALTYFSEEEIQKNISIPSAFRWCMEDISLYI